jgi:hypothetical protein
MGLVLGRLQVVIVGGLVLGCLALGPLAAAEPAPTLGDAVRAIEAGQVEEAYVMLLDLVQREPGNRAAALRLQQLENQRRTAAAREQALSRIILPRVQFREVTFNEALNHLSSATQGATDGQTNLNLVRLFTAEQGENILINLDLTNIPVWQALSLTAQQAGARLLPETHAIKVLLPE